MVKTETIHPFIKASSNGLVLDVRSPMEYNHGHLPGSISFPLFSDEERAVVGTLYKQKGKTEAILKGLEFVGPKLKGFAEKALGFNAPTLYIHCWRGGMRSESMAYVLQSSGLQCVLLKGGYKAYRNYIISQFLGSWKFKVIGGKTGSGKTKVLAELSKLGEQVLDLEALANHKGSAFGRIGELPQPTTEQFGNNLFHILSSFDSKKTIWIEDESHSIGSIFIPSEFYLNYRKAPLIVMDVSFDERVKNLVNLYGDYNIKELKEAFIRITRKLGGQHVKHALELLDQNQLDEAASIALKYYDKSYEYGLENKDTKVVSYVLCDNLSPEQIAKTLLKTI